MSRATSGCQPDSCYHHQDRGSLTGNRVENWSRRAKSCTLRPVDDVASVIVLAGFADSAGAAVTVAVAAAVEWHWEPCPLDPNLNPPCHSLVCSPCSETRSWERRPWT